MLAEAPRGPQKPTKGGQADERNIWSLGEGGCWEAALGEAWVLGMYAGNLTSLRNTHSKPWASQLGKEPGCWKYVLGSKLPWKTENI